MRRRQTRTVGDDTDAHFNEEEYCETVIDEVCRMVECGLLAFVQLFYLRHQDRLRGLGPCAKTGHQYIRDNRHQHEQIEARVAFLWFYQSITPHPNGLVLNRQIKSVDSVTAVNRLIHHLWLHDDLWFSYGEESDGFDELHLLFSHEAHLLLDLQGLEPIPHNKLRHWCLSVRVCCMAVFYVDKRLPRVHASSEEVEKEEVGDDDKYDKEHGRHEVQI